MKLVRYDPAKPLGKPKRNFNDTFSAETVVLEKFQMLNTTSR